MIRFHIDGESKWDYAVNDFHLQHKLAGRSATIARPLCGRKFWINAIKGLLGLNYVTFELERTC